MPSPGERPGIKPPGERPGIKPPGERPGIRPPGERPGIKPPGERPGIRPPGERPGLKPPPERPGWKPGDRPPRPGERPRPPWYRPGYPGHPGWWHGWRPGHGWAHWHYFHYRPWAWATWAGLSAWIGWRSQPVYYDYYVQDNYIYSGGEQIAPVQQYEQQAVQIADAAAQPTDATEWMPLGVFAVVPSEDSPVDVAVQLAISKEGTISGTFLNRAAQVTLPLLGSIDKTTQRAAWKVGEEDAIVMETQLDSLTKDQSTVLLYFPTGETESWWMFRIDKQTAEQIQAANAASQQQGQLAQAYELLLRSLNESWRSYLAIPNDALAGTGTPDVAALQKALTHYDHVATDPKYTTVAAYPGFSETYAALKALVAELAPPATVSAPARSGGGVRLNLPGVRINVGNGVQVRAPGVNVDTGAGGTRVSAPAGVNVDTGARGTRVTAPGVEVQR